MGETEKLQYRFTVSPDDVRPAIELANRNKMQEAGRNFAILLGASAVFYIASQTSDVLEIPFSLLGGMTLVAAISMIISTAFRRREKVPTFEPYSARIVATKAGLAHLTSDARVDVSWAAVEGIFVDEVGLRVEVAGSVWWIPKSVFATTEDMERDAQRLANMQAAANAIIPEIDVGSENAARTLH